MADEYRTSSSNEQAPINIDLKDRPELWSWRFKPGGDRLPRLAEGIPHLMETEYPESILNELTSLRLSKNLVNEAKQAQLEYIYSKQQADLLQDERELLKWHNSNNQKLLGVQKSERQKLEQDTMYLKKRLVALEKESAVLEKQKQHIMANTVTLEAELAALNEENASVQADLDTLVGARENLLAEITAERRNIGDERKRRSKQFSKLRLAVNRDKKVHSKLNNWKGMDELVLSTYERVNNFHKYEYAMANDIVKSQRDLFLQELTGKQ